MKQRPYVPVGVFFRGSGDPAYERAVNACRAKCRRYSRIRPAALRRQRRFLRRLFGRTGKDVTVVAPFCCDYGYNIEVGDRFYANHGLVVQDGAKVRFGSDVFIAPNCVFTTAEHAVDRSCGRRGTKSPSRSPSATTYGSAQGRSSSRA